MNKRNWLLSILIGLIIPVLIIVYWFWLGKNQKLNEALVPTIQQTINAAGTLIQNGQLFVNLGASVMRVLQGFLLGAVLGVLIGILMGFFKPIYHLLNGMVSVLRTVPMMALIPLLILWLGIGEECKVVLIALGTFWSVLLNTIHGIHTTDAKLLEVATVLEKKRFTTVTRVYLPSALPAIITGMRIGMGSAWSCVVAAEMVASSKGIGYMLIFARQLQQPNNLLVGVIAIGLIGFITDKLFLYAENKIVWWI